MEDGSWTHRRSYLPVALRIHVHCLNAHLTLQIRTLQAKAPAMPGSLRGCAPQRGSRGQAPWSQRSAPPALARKDRERFGERKGTHRNACFPSSLRASGNSNDLSMQFWSRRVPIHHFFTPLVIEGD